MDEPIPDAVPSSKYLGSCLTNDCRLDVKVENGVSHASRAYGRLRERVFQNRNLSLSTKVKVYKAIAYMSLGATLWKRGLDPLCKACKDNGNVGHKMP